jgi:hypothetical protein
LHVAAQAKVDYAQWRRQARRDAYSAFLAPASEAQNALKLAGRAFVGVRDTDEVDRQLQVAEAQLQLIRAAWASLAIEGPEPVTQAANGVRTALKSVQTTLLAWQDSPSSPGGNASFVERHTVDVAALSERLRVFTPAARAALDAGMLVDGDS